MGEPYKYDELYQAGYWMLTFCNRTAPKEWKSEYDYIVELVGASSPIPGGPVYRLGTALWAFHDRIRWLNNHALIVEEENIYYHFRKEHKPMSDRRLYKVRQAIEKVFFPMREAAFFAPPALLNRLPPITKPDTNRRRVALKELDLLARERKKPYLRSMVQLLATADPRGEDVLVAVVEAVKAQEQRLTAVPPLAPDDLFDEARTALNKALHLYHQNQVWMAGTPYEAADTLLRNTILKPSPA